MGQTPDDFYGGASDVDLLVFRAGSAPATPGHVSYTGGAFSAKDATGVFPLRPDLSGYAPRDASGWTFGFTYINASGLLVPSVGSGWSIMTLNFSDNSVETHPVGAKGIELLGAATLLDAQTILGIVGGGGGGMSPAVALSYTLIGS